MQAKPNRRAAGALVETFASQYLARQGYRLIQRNFYSRWGEIDLIVADSVCLVFVEVRHRLSARYGGALESITADKQRKLRQTAEFFIKQHYRQPPPCRFDVLCYSGRLEELSATSTPEWIESAF